MIPQSTDAGANQSLVVVAKGGDGTITGWLDGDEKLVVTKGPTEGSYLFSVPDPDPKVEPMPLITVTLNGDKVKGVWSTGVELPEQPNIDITK
jgi:hypothetical protein